MQKHIVLLLTLIAPTILGTQEQQSSMYRKIQPINLASLTWEDEEWPNEPFGDYIHRCLAYQTQLQEFKKRRIVFKIFDALTCTDAPQHNCAYDIETIKDLNLFAGKNTGDPYLAALIDRTKTELGKVFLYGLLSTPTHDIDTLLMRQNIIRTLVENNELSCPIDALYDQLSSSENMLLSNWTQDGFLNLTQRNYYVLPFLDRLSEYLNRSAWALELKSLYGHQERSLFLASGIFAAILLPCYGLSMCSDFKLPPILEGWAQRLVGSGGKINAILSTSTYQIIAINAFIAAGIACASTTKQDYEWVRDNITLEVCLQKKMIAIAKFLKSVTTLNAILEAHPAFLELCPAATKINHFMHTKCLESKFKKLFDLCHTPTLSSQESVFSLQGRVLASYKLFYDLKTELEPLMMAVGELDAYCSCARLFKEFEHKKVHFSFATYANHTAPTIIMNEFWNPFINPEKAVSNTIHLQGPDARNMIITGPNAGGKSTLIKAISINLILAQSIGLTAASHAEITPFYAIATYLNIVDDIASGNSLFKAQVLRAQEMMNLVDNTPAGQVSFIALDEMFNGTSAAESTAAAYSVIRHIGGYNNNISIVATHFPLLTNLANEGTTFENYKVCVEVDDQNHIHYPFKLEKGISHQHVALDILKQQGYDCSIIDQASNILKEMAQ